MSAARPSHHRYGGSILKICSRFAPALARMHAYANGNVRGECMGK
jgi:hypothetical protein